MRRITEILVGGLLLLVVGLSAANTPAAPQPKKTPAATKKVAPTKKALEKRKEELQKRPATSRGDIDEELYRIRRLYVLVTAYSAPCPVQGTGSRTATGRRVYRVVDGRIVKVPGCAVDPKLIKLGSIVEINGRLYPADDTGGAIKGHRIDLRVDSRRDALIWGRRWITVTVYERRGTNGCQDDRESSRIEPSREDGRASQAHGSDQ